MLKETNPTIQTACGRVRKPRDQGSVENMQKQVKAVLKRIKTELRHQGMDPNWTELLGHVMGALNKSSGDHLVEVPPYKAIFGMEYDPPLRCSMEEIRGCKTIQDCLALVPDERLETFAKNSGDLCTPTKEEEEEDANALIRKQLIEKTSGIGRPMVLTRLILKMWCRRLMKG